MIDEYRDFWESNDLDHLRYLIACDRPWIESCKHAHFEWWNWILTPAVKLHPNPVIVEWGCGVGRLLQSCPINARLVGIDMSRSMLKKAVELSNAIFLKTDGRTCSLMSDSVDFVYCFLVLQHVPKKSMIELMVGEWHRILKPGGIVRAQTLCCPPPTNEEFNGFAGHSYSSGQDFFDLFKDAGFSVSEQHSGGLNDSPVTDATAKTGDWMWITAQKT